MSRIHILPPEVAEKIAAGEVIERPASVVKELVENALDAGARRVTVETEGGGKRRIRVTDDGGGMTAEEAGLALYRHATSKLHSAEDLFAIGTLGFRGEAIPSIAAVSEMEILTRTPEDAEGTLLLVRGGEVLTQQSAAAALGTRVTVTELFHNVPVREKFLRSDVAEAGHVTDWLQRLALCRPDVSFRLTHDGREALLSPGSRDPLNAVVAVMGRAVARDLLPVAGAEGGVDVSGYVGRPTLSRATRALQHTYVNGRAVRTALVYRALDAAFRSTMPAGRHPVAVLFLRLPPGEVDVNVHPAKTEVRFQDEAAIGQAVRHAVVAALGAVPVAAVPATETVLEAPPASTDVAPAGGGQTTWTAPPAPTTGPAGLQVVAESGAAPTAERLSDRRPSPYSLPPPSVERSSEPLDPRPNPAPGNDRLPHLEYLGQAQDLFILAHGDGKLWVIDQHVAHERVLFDRFTAPGATLEPPEPLLFPARLQVTRPQALALDEHRALLADLGFVLEPGAAGTYTLRSVPRSLLGRNYEAVLLDLAEELAEQSQGGRIRLQPEAVAAAAAGRSCKAAVKAGQRLAPTEVNRLLAELREARNPHTCPHGRPVFLTYEPAEIQRLFGATECPGKQPGPGSQG